MDQSALVVIRC